MNASPIIPTTADQLAVANKMLTVAKMERELHRRALLACIEVLEVLETRPAHHDLFTPRASGRRALNQAKELLSDKGADKCTELALLRPIAAGS